MVPSTSAEDYLKTVWKLSSRTPEAGGGPVAPSELARALAVSTPSVSGMIRKLRAQGLLVDSAPGTAVELTTTGERAALGVVRRHRLLETFLVDVLGLGWDEVHAEAEILEHALTPRVEQALTAYLGDPGRDPHGDPIPPVAGRYREDWGQALGGVGDSGDFVVERVEDSDPTVLRHLASLGITPGTRLHLAGRDDHGGPLWVRVCSPGGDSERVALGSGLVQRVHGSLGPRDARALAPAAVAAPAGPGRR